MKSVRKEIVEEILKNHLTEAEVAHVLRITPDTLKLRRSEGRNHPPFRKEGRETFYPKSEFIKWMMSKPLHVEVRR